MFPVPPRAQNTATSGILSDYAQLQPDPDNQRNLTYVRAGTDWTVVRKARIEGIEFRLPEKEAKKLTEMERTEFERELREILQTELAARFAITEQSEPGTLCIRVAIT